MRAEISLMGLPNNSRRLQKDSNVGCNIPVEKFMISGNLIFKDEFQTVH